MYRLGYFGTFRVVIDYWLKLSGVVFHFSIMTIPKSHSYCNIPIPQCMLKVKIICTVGRIYSLLYILNS